MIFAFVSKKGIETIQIEMELLPMESWSKKSSYKIELNYRFVLTITI